MERKHYLPIGIFLLVLCTSFSAEQISWGFFAHQKINRLAVFALPPEMIGFYKKNIHYLSEKAVNPDMRRYVDKREAPRHYIDLDIYGDSALWKVPKRWNKAVEKYSQDTLEAYGIVPWHIYSVHYRLTEAFKTRNAEKILRYSADLGHYIADANVPLHTTENYNGQFTGQYGIHGFWESRLPELFFKDYEFFVGKAKYIEYPQEEAWSAVTNAHMALDSVLQFEKKLTLKFDESKKYGFESRGASTVKVYSYDFAKSYHDLLDGMVERRMRASVKMVADFWYTCWINAGQPDLSTLNKQMESKEKLAVDSEVKIRGHESGH